MAYGKLAFGPFMLDAVRGALLRDGAPVALGQRALAVLAALGETPGRTVAKDDLLARAWPGTLVEEGNLTVQIAALRKALGPGPDGRDWIVTVPRIGYRLRARRWVRCRQTWAASRRGSPCCPSRCWKGRPATPISPTA